MEVIAVLLLHISIIITRSSIIIIFMGLLRVNNIVVSVISMERWYLEGVMYVLLVVFPLNKDMQD